MKNELDKSKASFKLDLIETANVDPMIRPADFKLLAAYVSLMEWPSCRCELAMSLAMAKTGLSDRQIEKSRARLLGKNAEGRAYLSPVRRRSNSARYMLINPWRNESRDHTIAMLRYHQEAERQKKSKKRAALSPNSVRGQNEAVPEFCSVLSPNSVRVSTPMSTPSKKERRAESPPRSNVVPINTSRRIA